MTGIDWTEIENFVPGEFPADPDRYADPRLIRRVDRYRGLIGQRIWPTTQERGFVRFGDDDADNWHYCAPDGSVKTRALDVFAEGSPMQNWLHAVGCGLWGGVGVYFGTFYGGRHNLWPMLHLDIRPRELSPFLWYRTPDKTYRYFMAGDGSAMEEFLRMFQTYGLAAKRLKRRAA